MKRAFLQLALTLTGIATALTFAVDAKASACEAKYISRGASPEWSQAACENVCQASWLINANYSIPQARAACENPCQSKWISNGKTVEWAVAACENPCQAKWLISGRMNPEEARAACY
ncbi:MAG: hypothetical protein EOP06_08310 [Proteobacteria bacterium]|nr:MAG: hypothetical protein EOP06_08310 [Pseudomonadota bacterium]